MDTQRPAEGRLRGRSGELKAVAGLLDAAATGHEAILLVDGAPGIGKTRLLAAAEKRAKDDGFSVVSAHAGELPRPLPLAPLFSGLVLAPPGGRPARAPGTEVHLHACLEKLAVHTGKLAARGPVFITLDDVQWADATTVTALRELPAWVGADHPVGWALVRRIGTRQPSDECLFGDWEREGAARIALGPLADHAVVEVIADVLGARPDDDLLAMARGAAGNPRLVRALLDGLRNEGGVAIAGGRARLLAEHPPGQVRDVVHDWIMRLSAPARHLLGVAASFDRLFGADDLADLLGWSNEQVRPPLQELVAADLLTVVANDVLGFHHELVRRSVADDVPAAVRIALCGEVAAKQRPSLALPATSGADRRSGSTSVRGRVNLRHQLRWADKCADGSQDAAEAWGALTGTERTVAELVAQGLTNREVAARVFLSPHTVSFHLRKVYRKLGIRSRVDLTRAFVHRDRDRRSGDDATAGTLI
ncbi:AAA family ATPase [Kribbella sp. NPDC004875]|uniref:helix-turn-helix transcriptional regulator n=1 Tax=Kribbella sp. NPDC004875 TaxID=3364107 RepID=UPI0036A4307C